MMKWLMDRLVIDRWRDAFQRYSVRLAAATALLSTLLLANKDLVLGLLGSLPANSFLRILIAVCVGFVVFVVPTLTVLWKQQDKPNG